jgi:hypothetical protein
MTWLGLVADATAKTKTQQQSVQAQIAITVAWVRLSTRDVGFAKNTTYQASGRNHEAPTNGDVARAARNGIYGNRDVGIKGAVLALMVPAGLTRGADIVLSDRGSEWGKAAREAGWGDTVREISDVKQWAICDESMFTRWGGYFLFLIGLLSNGF